MSKWARKTDANHNPIIEAYEKMGVAVVDLSRCAELAKPGLPDLLCSLHGYTWLSETKTEGGKLAPVQQTFQRDWKGQVVVVRNEDDVIRVVTHYRLLSRSKIAPV